MVSSNRLGGYSLLPGDEVRLPFYEESSVPETARKSARSYGSGKPEYFVGPPQLKMQEVGHFHECKPDLEKLAMGLVVSAEPGTYRVMDVHPENCKPVVFSVNKDGKLEKA
jgi:hypothetical protein